MNTVLQSLPVKLPIYGNAVSKRVYLDAVELHTSYSTRIHLHAPQFDWGTDSPGTQQLALAILLQYLPIDIAVSVYDNFALLFIQHWHTGNIDMTINLSAIVMDLLKLEALPV